MSRNRRGGRLAALFALGLAVGCGSGPKVGTVVGSVTLDGKPVPAGVVTAIAKAGGTPVTADINPDGTYQLLSVPVGDVLIGVADAPVEAEAAGQKMKEDGAGPPAKGKAAGPPAAAKVKIPPRYADPGASGLTVAVKENAAGNTTFDIPLKK